MNRRLLCLLAAGVMFAVTPVWAGEILSIRLVKADNSGGGQAGGLDDVIEVLRNSLVFKTYSLMASTTVAFPVKSGVLRLGDYLIDCSGGQADLTIRVRSGRRELLKTAVSLGDNKPLILGGFPCQGGKHILVFLTQR